MIISSLYNKNNVYSTHLVDSYQLKLFGSHNFYKNGILINTNGDIIDEHNEYIINSKFFRSKNEIESEIDNLIVGCSVTYGIGVPEEDTWGSLVSKNKKYFNMGICGVGAEVILKNILAYINLYGKPKNIYCFFPDFLRMLFINDKNHHHIELINYKSNYALETVVYLKTVDGGGRAIPSDKFLKSPINTEQNISPHYGIKKNINSIYFLQEFCNMSDINLLWSTWSIPDALILKYLFKSENFILDKNKYIELKENFFLNDFTVDCKESHDHPKYKQIQWDIGTDLGRHPGIHWHYHVAETFLNKINSSIH